jgi:hypothetical protein
LFELEWTTPIEPGSQEVTFQVQLEQTGFTHLDAWFRDASGEERGAYYVTVERRAST